MPPGLTDVVPNDASPNWTVSVVTGKNNSIKEIDWTNGNLPAGERTDFLFQAQVPSKPTTLDWKAYQTYSDGEVVSWDRPPVTMMNMSNMSDFTKYGPYSTTQIINDLTSQNSMNTMMNQMNNSISTALGLSILASVLAAAGVLMQLRKK